ncbi:transmembrane protein 65 isoform X4 [Drosophila santomea]|uniref:transmembrane protein 65 isoform X4 n=1 Tax=Drosophila santomea TaxID=129105 RepID=UPI0019534F87|nr:transmembrane protein 65 isoform X4 [Drosophila santomea]
MQNTFQAAFSGLTRQYIIKQSWPCGRKLLRTKLIIPPSSTSSPFKCRNYSKFSTHLSMDRAMELLCNLDDEERSNLRSALGRLDADKEKKLYEIETAASPTAGQLYSIFFVNAVPFVAFGFLDNFIMIMAGEYIEYYLGHFITLSTMAAAGLGNTISDILGITMATYVENGCQILGLKQPNLTPAQFELKSSKRSSSYGRIVGITVGCLLGMCPLWYMDEKADKVNVTDEIHKK